MALVPLAVAAALGSSTGYTHATYMLIVSEPAITVVAFSPLAAAAYIVSQQVARAYERLALVFARVSVLLVNFGFWVGSLWGDYPGQSWVHGGTYSVSETWRAWRAAAWHIPDTVFAVGWAVLLVAVGIWGAYVNRRWVINTAATFGAIHFYSQWFERLGAQPWAIIVAGLAVFAIAVTLWRYNARRAGAASPRLAASHNANGAANFAGDPYGARDHHGRDPGRGSSRRGLRSRRNRSGDLPGIRRRAARAALRHDVRSVHVCQSLCRTRFLAIA
jgi:hypothetical protein